MLCNQHLCNSRKGVHRSALRISSCVATPKPEERELYVRLKSPGGNPSVAQRAARVAAALHVVMDVAAKVPKILSPFLRVLIRAFKVRVAVRDLLVAQPIFVAVKHVKSKVVVHLVIVGFDPNRKFVP